MPSELVYSSSGDVDIRVSWGSNESGTVQVVTEAADRTDKDPTERLIGRASCRERVYGLV